MCVSYLYFFHFAVFGKLEWKEGDILRLFEHLRRRRHQKFGIESP